MWWKIAICQHPMPLLIQKGEPGILEREPPWGENTLPAYLDRIERNLEYLEKNPGFRLNYELSALELELIHDERPGLVRKLRDSLSAGRIGFVGGTYSQPHLQVFDSETNYLQFELGLEVFSRLLGHTFQTYATQETGVHDQLPQLLKSRGYRYATVPAFYWALDLAPQEGLPTLVGNWLHMAFMHDGATCFWKGLDGTRLPLFLEVTDRFSEDFFFRKEQKGMFGESGLYTFFPDLLEIDDDFAAQVRSRGEPVLLDTSLAEQFASHPPRYTGRLHTYWSYAEGTEAEATLREHNLAVAAIQQAEGVVTIAGAFEGCAAASFVPQWKRILATQHHDVHWCETIRLKREAQRDLQACAREASDVVASKGRAILERVHTAREDVFKLGVFNSLPYERTDRIEFTLSFDQGEAHSITLRGSNGGEIPVQIIAEGRYPDRSLEWCRCLAVVTIGGLGYHVYGVTSAPRPSDSKPTDTLAAQEEWSFSNPYYRADLGPDGVLKCLRTTSEERNLLGRAGAAWFSAEGRRLECRPAHTPPASYLVHPGSVCSVTEYETLLPAHGGRIVTQCLLYRSLPRIDFHHRLEFRRAAIANLWDDSQKLNWIWSLDFAGQITHDIPFGVSSELPGRPILCPSWVDYGNGAYGVSVAHLSHPKFWVQDRQLANVIAWGGRQVSNRQHRFWVDDADVDLLLDGTYLADHAIFPHAGDWRTAGIPRLVRGFREPLIPVAVRNGSSEEGRLPREFSLLCIGPQAIVPSSTRLSRDAAHSFTVHFYETYGEATSLAGDAIRRPAGHVTVDLLEHNEGSIIRPHAIGHIECSYQREVG